MEQEEYPYDLFDYFLLDQIRIRIESLVKQKERRNMYDGGFESFIDGLSKYFYLIDDAFNKKCKIFEFIDESKRMGDRRDTNEEPFVQIPWVEGCPVNSGMYWITAKMLNGSRESFVAKFIANKSFMLLTRQDLAPIAEEDVIAFIPFTPPVPYRSFSSKRCPFCDGLGSIDADDMVTCFNCDYTVKLSVWEGR